MQTSVISIIARVDNLIKRPTRILVKIWERYLAFGDHSTTSIISPISPLFMTNTSKYSKKHLNAFITKRLLSFYT